MNRFVSFLLVFLLGCGQGSSKDDSSPKSAAGSPEKGKRDVPVDFTLSALNRQVYTLSRQKGKVVLLNFWATWCPPCRVEIPELVALYNKYKSQGLLVLGIGIDKENALKDFVEKRGITYPVFVGNEKIAKDYKVKGIPTTYIIDREGKIVFHHVGFTPGMEKTLEEEIITLLNEDL